VGSVKLLLCPGLSLSLLDFEIRALHVDVGRLYWRVIKLMKQCNIQQIDQKMTDTFVCSTNLHEKLLQNAKVYNFFEMR